MTSAPPYGPLLENISDGVLLLDGSGTIMYASPAVTRILGLEAAELGGRKVFEFHHPDDVRRAVAEYEAMVAAPGSQTTVRLRARHKDGSWRWIESIRKNLLHDPAVGAIVVTCRDITTRRADEAQRARRQRYAEFLERFTMDFSRYREPAALFSEIARRCTELLGEWSSIASIAPGEPHLRFEAVCHWDPQKVARFREVVEASPLRVDDPTIRAVLEQRGPVAFERDDPAAQGLTREMPAAAAAFTHLGMLAVLAVPIYVADRPIGLLNIGTVASRHWDDEDLRLASLIADRAGAAIQNARLIEAERTARRDAERTAARTARLQRVTAALSEALTVTRVAEVILEQGTEAVGAAAGSVSLLSPDGETLDLLRAVGYPTSTVDTWLRAPLPVQAVLAEVVRRGEPIFLESADAQQAGFPAAVPAAFQPFAGPRAVLPLVIGTRMLGVMSMAFASHRSLDEEERGFIATLAGQCAQALERARLYERERRVAETLQRSLLPAGLPEVPGIQIAARYLPAGPEARVGGDWYDALALADGRLALVIGDVVGHGIPAASVMGRLRNALRAYAAEVSSPEEVVRRLNGLLERGESATLVYLVLDPTTGTLTYANAGHMPPLVIGPHGRAEFLGGASPALYRLPVPYREFTATVPEGSTIVLYTDGLVEDRARRTIDEGLARLQATAEQARGASAEFLVERIVSAQTAGRALEDDVAVLVVSLEPAADRALSLRVPAVPESAQVVRRSLWRWLTVLDVDPRRREEIVAASGEACNNAIEHAYNAADAHFSFEAAREDDDVVILVRDQGQWRPPRPGHNGFGFTLMRGLMDAVEVDRRSDGTTVRLRRRVRPEVRA